MKVLNNLDLTTNQLLNAKLQNLASDLTPGGGNASQIWYNTGNGQFKGSNGTTVDTLTNILEAIAGTGAIQVAAISGKSQTISILAASGSQAGTMSSGDYTKLASATNSNTASAIVQRDASGNFSAGTITAALTGTASNATQLNSQAASYYLARANQTGTQTASTISDFDTQVNTHRLDQLAAPTAVVSYNAQRITNVADPASPQDAATKNYVDASAAGYDTKASVGSATTTNLAATYSAGVLTASGNGVLSIDGVSPSAGDRVLVKNQTTTTQNGIYVVTNVGAAGSPFVLTRSSDANGNSGSGASALNPGSFVFVEAGTANIATAWVMTTTGSITIGTSAIVFTQVGSQSAYTAGNGLSLVGNQFSAVGTTNRVTVGASIDIASTYVGQASITTVGTISTGVWNGTAIAVANGGTGATTAAAARSNLAALTKYAQTLSTSATSYTVNHNLNSRDVDCIVYDAASYNVVMVDVVYTDVNNVTLTFATAPAANAYRVVILG